MKKHCILAQLCAVLALLPISAFSRADPAPADVVRDKLHTRYPDVTIEDVRPASIAGWYEVFTGSELVYSDASGDHLFIGKLLDTQTHQDLTAEKLRSRLSIDFQSLPFERAIKIVKGNGTHRLALFEDPDCPFCQKLEQQLADLHDVTLYVFLFPIPELHPQAREHAHAIWCAPDRAAAWTHWMLERTAPAPAECTGDPIEQLQSVGAALYVKATPTLFLPSGSRLQGVIAAPELQKLLELPASNGAAASAVGDKQAPPSVNKLSSRAAIVAR